MGVFLVFLLIWATLHFYVVARLLSVPFIAHHVPTAVLVAVIVLLGTSYILSRVLERFSIGGPSHLLEHLGAYWVGFFFLLLTAFFFVDLVSGFGFWLRPQVPMLRTWALAAAAIFASIALVQAHRAPVVTEYEVVMSNLPRSADGTVLVVASDMHLGSMLGYEWATRRAEQFNALEPDVILLVGDIFEGDQTTHAVWLPILQQIRAPKGVFLVTGNHEFYAGPDKIIPLLRQAGYRVLRDESAEPIPGLVITGVDDIAFRPKAEHAAAVERVLRERPAGATIFLSHTPIQARPAAESGVNLMLSGHTHNGQIWPFRFIVRMVFPLITGRYEVDGMTVIVGRGTGTWGPRMRLWQRSELLKIKLRATS